MTYIKLLTALAGLALLTACGGSSPTTPANNSTGGDNSGGDNSGGDNSGGNNNGGGNGGNATDCTQTPFHDDCLMNTGAIALRESMCLANIMIDDSCRGDRGIATVFCKDDPFNTATACMADTYLPARITNCITAGNANSNNNCNTLFTASASNTCLTNPFTDACTSNTDFGTYANTARTNRVSFCGMTGNAGNTLCSAGSGYANCVANPFATECGTYFQFAEESYCATNDVTDCPNVTSADWVAGFGNTPPITAGDYTRNELHEFLQGTTKGLNAGTVKTSSQDPTIFTLNLASIGGEAKNGVGWFQALSGEFGVTDPYRHYSGIFSGTNLGAPLTSADASVSVPWAGKIGWRHLSVSLDDNNAISRDFTLTVDFSNSEIRAFVNSADADHFLLKAEFDDTGRFNGTIIHATFAGSVEAGAQTNVTNGVLTGLIGKQGAVGAFYGGADDTDDSQGDFSGGFVAVLPDPCVALSNCADTAAWLASFEGGNALPTKPDATPTNEFLAITATTASSLTDAVPTTLFMTGRTDNGLAFFKENGAYYAGVLAGTNLGAPITETITNARWAGQIRTVGSSNDTTLTENEISNFGLNITFDGTKGTLKTIFAASPLLYYSIDGKFDANGIITGDIHYGFTTGDGASRVVNRDHGFYTPGTLTGIIGTNGAVGAFINGHDTISAGATTFSSYAGGFVAKPPE